MKKQHPQVIYTFVFILFGFISTQPIKAQSEFGIKGGILFSNINEGGPNSNLSFKRQEGLSTGLFYKKSNLFGPIGFQGEFLYQLKGAEVFIEIIDPEAYGYSNDINLIAPAYYHSQEKLHYFSMPLLLTVKTTKFLDLYAGPELNYLFKMNSDRIETNQLNRFSLGIATGLDLKLGENTHLDLRYSYDLTPYDNMGDNQNPIKLKNYGFAVSIKQTIFRKQ
jgi:hypothetical protein